MGRYLLLIVLAAAFGGTLLTAGMQGTMGATAQRHADGQADVLAREIAAAGQSAAVNAMLGASGFQDPTRTLGTDQDYEGGRFTIAYTPGSSEREASIRVSGAYGGATHTIESRYAYDPMDAPGPMWLDVPYATASVSSRAEIDGGKPIQVDSRKHGDLELDGLLPLDDMASGLATAMDGTGSSVAVPDESDWTTPGGLLDPLNVSDAEGLYTKAVGALDTGAGDQLYTGDQVVSGRMSMGSSTDRDGILMIAGDLTIEPGGSVEGYGMLVIDGALRVQADPGGKASKHGALDWAGIVLVRSTEAVLPVELEGVVEIEGMMVVDHQAFPPGGHLDVSVYRAEAGMRDAAPEGDLSDQRSPWAGRTRDGAPYPWHQHTHAFDISPSSAPRGDHVYFLENGRDGRHEGQVQFAGLLDRLGDQEVYLEIANGDNHGFSRYALKVTGRDGTSGPLEGTVQGGFGEFARADAPLRTRVFEADQLKDFDLDVQSLRALKQSFDDPSCESWPMCIGRDWEREGSMAVRLHRATDHARLYEATLYWHMRTDEMDRHAAEEEAWRARIAAGEAFGTHLTLGDDVAMTFAIGSIDALSERLDFDGDKVRLIETRSSHVSAEESDAPDVRTGASTGTLTVCLAGESIQIPTIEAEVYLAMGASAGPCDGSGGEVQVCHKSGGPNRTIEVDVDALAVHLGHGDDIGPCDEGGESGGESGGELWAPPGYAWICNKPGRAGEWWSRLVEVDRVADHVSHGCLTGTCASNGR